MANTLRIKRRAAGGASGAPASLANAELAFNEQDNTLYYGWGTGGAGGTATQCQGIGGDGMGNTDAAKILMNGTQSAGDDLKWARANHVHPTDTSRAPTASPTLTGTVTVTGIAAVTAASASPALQVTQTGSGPALLIEDSANPDSTPFTISTGGYVGIGTTTPVAQLDIRNGYINHTYSSVNSQGSVIKLQKARGTDDAPTIALTGDELGSILFAGYNGSLFTGGAMIAALTPSGSAVSPTNLPGQIDFYTTPVGSTTRSRAMSLLSTGVMDLQNHKIVNLADPVNPQDAATKAYVDAARSGLDVKDSCRVASTANIDLSTTLTTLTVDGVSLAVGNRVLVKDQTTASQNGIYVVSNLSGSGPNWVRATDFDANEEVTAGAFTFVSEGSTQADTGWVLTTNDPITLGTTGLSFTLFSSAGNLIAGAGLVKTGNAIDAVGTANRITVNADSIDISSNYAGQTSIVTLGTIGTGTWQGTVVAPAYGGTGLSSYTIGDLIYASGATTLAKLAGAGTTGSVLLSGTSAPSWGKVGLTTHVSGTLAVGNGGTGIATATANGVLYGNGTSAMGVTAAGTWDATNSVGQLLSVNASGVPTWTNTIDGGSY